MTNKEKIKNAIKGFIIADAAGVPLEFQYSQDIPFTKDSNIEFLSGGIHKQSAGTWSDDTSMMLCVMDALYAEERGENLYKRIKENLVEWKEDDIKNKWSCDYLFDIGNGTSCAIENIKKGIEPSGSTYSKGNGALLKILPFLNKIENNYMTLGTQYQQIKEMDEITHNSNISILSMFYIQILHNLVHGYNFQHSFEKAKYEIGLLIPRQIHADVDLYNYISSCIGTQITEVDGCAWGSLAIAINSVYESKSFDEAVMTAICYGGDTDSNASITGAFAGTIFGVDEELWIQVREHKRLEKMIDKFLGIN